MGVQKAKAEHYFSLLIGESEVPGGMPGDLGAGALLFPGAALILEGVKRQQSPWPAVLSPRSEDRADLWKGVGLNLT